MLAQRVGAEAILYQGQFGIGVNICDNLYYLQQSNFFGELEVCDKLYF